MAKQWTAALGLLGAVALTAFAPGASDFAFGLGYAALLAAALGSGRWQGRLERAFAWPPLVWMGMVSYSLYLTHSLFIERGVQAYHWLVPIAHTTLATDVAAVAAFVAAVIGGGWAFYRVVEHRFVRSVDAAGR